MTAPTNRIRGKRSWKQTDFLVPSQRLPTRRKTGRERGYRNRGIASTRKVNPRGMERRQHQERYEPTSVKVSPRSKPTLSDNATKREFLNIAWEVGFRGKSYRKAKRYERALERAKREAAR